MKIKIQEYGLIKWLNKIVTFRWAFLFFLFVTLFFDEYLFPELSSIGFYVFFYFILGFGFRESRAIRIVLTGLITYIRYETSSTEVHIHVFFFSWITNYLITEVISILLKYIIIERQNIINITLAFVKSLDARDTYTASHSENVANYALKIAKEMKLSKKLCNNIYLGGLMHDIGKIGVPEIILAKPSSLTADEYEIIKQHSIIGYDILKHISMFKDKGILNMIRHHHERYDGTGYPDRLKGTQIPLEARIITIADSFDAMVSRRVYREKQTLDYAMEQIRSNRGLQFDPEIADAFLNIIEKERTSRI